MNLGCFEEYSKKKLEYFEKMEDFDTEFDTVSVSVLLGFLL